MRTLLILSLFSLTVMITGCAQTEPSTATTDESVTPSAATETETAVAANKNCPIMGHEVSPDGGSTTWNGQTIGFCCEGCLPKWDELSDDEKKTKLAKADSGDHEGNS